MSMIDKNFNPSHFIQRYILNVLRHNEYARFRDLRPDGVDSNAFSYHLTQLTKQDLVQKSDHGYTLTIRGLEYIDRVSSLDTRPRRQPKIMTLTAIVNEDGELLLRRKLTQPMINRMTMPCGMLHMDDDSIEAAALREIREKVGLSLGSVHHIGDCYMAVRHDGVVIMNTLMHVFYARVAQADVTLSDDVRWMAPDELLYAASASRHVAEKLRTIDPERDHFFEEYIETL